MPARELSYDLTDYTGKRKNVSRKDIVANYSVNYRDMTLAVTACGIALVPMAFGLMIFGAWGLLAFPITIIAAFFLLDNVGGDKLQTKRYQSIDNAIGARGGRRIFAFLPSSVRGDKRGLQAREGVILVSGMPLVAPTPVEVAPLVIPNPHRFDAAIRRDAAIRQIAAGDRSLDEGSQ